MKMSPRLWDENGMQMGEATRHLVRAQQDSQTVSSLTDYHFQQDYFFFNVCLSHILIRALFCTLLSKWEIESVSQSGKTAVNKCRQQAALFTSNPANYNVEHEECTPYLFLRSRPPQLGVPLTPTERGA